MTQDRDHGQAPDEWGPGSARSEGDPPGPADERGQTPSRDPYAPGPEGTGVPPAEGPPPGGQGWLPAGADPYSAAPAQAAPSYPGAAPYGAGSPYTAGLPRDDGPSFGAPVPAGYGSGAPGSGPYGGPAQPTYPLPSLGSPQRGPEYVPGRAGDPIGSASPYVPAYGSQEALPAKASGRRWGPIVALVLAGALVGGGAGAAVASALDNGNSSSAQPSAVFTQGGNTPVDGRPNSVTSIAKKVLPSVVTVNVTGNGQEGNGSGVIITSDGYILTNNHVAAVAADGGSIQVDFYNGKAGVAATIVGRDPKSDLAVLKVSGLTNLPAATLGRSSSLQVGDPVVAVGAPLDLSSTVTTGIVSALNRNVTVPGENGGRNVIIGAIQTDAAINPGNSGGALADGLGQVVGINTAIATANGGSGSIGLGFAIPIDYAKSIADEIIRTGHATHPYVGVSASTVTSDEAKANGTSPGAQVESLVAGGPAQAAGLQRGDVITKVDDTDVKSVDDLVAATRLHKIGDTVRVTFERNGQTHTVDVRLQEAPSE